MDGCLIDANLHSSSEILSDVGENPNHLFKFNFPKRAFGVLFSKTSIIFVVRNFDSLHHAGKDFIAT